MKKFSLYFVTILIITTLGSFNAFSEEKSDSVATNYRKDMHLSLFASADAFNPSGLNATLGIISSIEIYHNKNIPISAFYEINYSIPLIKDSSYYFSCINAGLKFTRRITDSWSLGLDFGSGIALFDGEYNVNSVVRAVLTYRGISLFVNMRSIISKSSNATINGIGFSYTIY